MSNFITNRAGSKMINGLVLGPELLAKFYQLPSVPHSNLVFTNVTSDSLLGDVLFKSDYRLKSLCAYPDARAKFPGHLTELEFMQKYGQQQGYDLPAGSGAMAGHRLVPGEVTMHVSPDGQAVAFPSSQVKVIGWIINYAPGGVGRGPQLPPDGDAEVRRLPDPAL